MIEKHSYKTHKRILLSVIFSVTFFCVGCNKTDYATAEDEDTTASAESEKVTTRVPELIGLTKEEAEDLLYEADLAETTKYIFSDEVPEGIIIDIMPEAGTVAKKGTGIQLNISKGPDPEKPEPTPEPNKTVYIIPSGIIGLPINEAIGKLAEMGIIARSSNRDPSSLTQEEIDNLTWGTVVECVPSEGEEYVQLDDGSTCVILYYY